MDLDLPILSGMTRPAIGRVASHVAGSVRTNISSPGLPQDEAYALRTDKDIETGAYVHKLILTGQPGRGVKAVARDAWGNLRAALDHLNAACARLGGASKHDSRAQFPFAKDANSLPSEVRRRCRNVPQAVTDYFASLCPYPGGDDRLFGLTRIRNANEHWKLRSAIFQAVAVQIVWPNTSPRKSTIIEIGSAISPMHEVELFTSDSPAQNYAALLLAKISFEDFEAFGTVAADEA